MAVRSPPGPLSREDSRHTSVPGTVCSPKSATSSIQLPVEGTVPGTVLFDDVERQIRIENLRWYLALWLAPPRR